jgi:hypothetical protein
VYCSNCGVRQDATARFCANCGAGVSIGAPAQHLPSPQPVPAPVSELPAPPSEAPRIGGSAPASVPSTPGHPAPAWGAPVPPDQTQWLAPAAPTPGPAVDNTFGWLLAFAPLLLALGDLIIGGTDLSSDGYLLVSFAVAFGVNTALAIADTRRLKHFGIELSAALAVLLVPVYLFMRAKRSGQSYAIPAVWCVTFLVSVVSGTLTANTIGVQIDSGAVEREIQSGIEEQADVSGVTVDCPAHPQVKPGSTFQCIASADGESVMVDVTVQGADGEFVWNVRG